MLTIAATDIHLNIIIGVYDDEKLAPQNLYVDFTIEYEGDTAAQSDNVADTLDYCELTKRIVAKTKDTKFELIERLSDFILDLIMEEPLAQHAMVTIKKPGALANFGALVAVTNSRSR